MCVNVCFTRPKLMQHPDRLHPVPQMEAKDEAADVATHTKPMTKALALVSGAIAHAQKTLHQRDMHDPLSPWSLEDIRSLRVAVQRTLEKLSKEEELFTGVADLRVRTSRSPTVSSTARYSPCWRPSAVLTEPRALQVYDDSKIRSMLSDVRNTSMRLANLRGAIVFKPEITKTEPVGCACVAVDLRDETVMMLSLEAACKLALRSERSMHTALC
jgi:hypothetical protein